MANSGGEQEMPLPLIARGFGFPRALKAPDFSSFNQAVKLQALFGESARLWELPTLISAAHFPGIGAVRQDKSCVRTQQSRLSEQLPFLHVVCS